MNCLRVRRGGVMVESPLRAGLKARLQRLRDLAPPRYEPISPALNRAFVRMYEAEVKLAYQRSMPPVVRDGWAQGLSFYWGNP